MPHRKPIDYAVLAQKLGHVFVNPILLHDALTHPSLPTAKSSHKITKPSPYERLEFLGDRVLGLVIAHWLYEMFPQADEGELAKRHAHLVNRDMLNTIALSLKLQDHLRLARGESANESRKNLAALSDAMEGVIGALYLDGGFDLADTFIKTYWTPWIGADLAPPADPKTALQEYAQSKGYVLPKYSIVEHSGPSHAPKFRIQVVVAGHDPVIAEGGSKREAEKKAASMLLEEITKR
ncbi:MAG: ribonuclease III [Alphaproteobacteria bacterium]|nr:ribonuclease III [Alphaproteobacteria bacterium]